MRSERIPLARRSRRRSQSSRASALRSDGSAMVTVTKEDLETPRTAKEYLGWVELKMQQVAASNKGRKSLRLRQGLSKVLVEEALPLAIFATKHYQESRCVTILHRVGDQNYDAEVKDRRIRKSPFEYVEITQAHEGENDHLRMLALERDGRVSVLGKVTKSGTKATGITGHVENEAKRHREVHAEELMRVKDAIQKKLEKAYPNSTALVVAFDDYMAIRSDSDMDSLRDYLSGETLAKINNFRWLALVGWGKRNYLEFDLGRNAI